MYLSRLSAGSESSCLRHVPPGKRSLPPVVPTFASLTDEQEGRPLYAASIPYDTQDAERSLSMLGIA